MTAHMLHARHHSTSGFQLLRKPSLQIGGEQSSSLRALDLHRTSELDLPSILASLRVHVLCYLSDLEARLALLDFKSKFAARLSNDPSLKGLSSEDGSSTSEAHAALDNDDDDDHREEAVLHGYDLKLHTEDVAAFISGGLELLQIIRADVLSYLPDVEFPALHAAISSATRENLRRRLNELSIHPPQLPNIDKFVLGMSVMPSVDALRSRLFDFGPSAATAAAEMRVQVELAPLSYIPRLKAHLTRLQAHMEALSSCFSSRSDQPLSPSGGSFPFHISITPPKIVTELLAALLEKDTEEAIEADIQKAKEDEETMHEQVKRLLLKSDFGKTLVRYEDLPVKWRNNEFVLTGYRFIPARSWRALLFSVFQLHNETTNIHTHLLPLITTVPLLATLVNNYVLRSSFSFVTAFASFFNSLSTTYCTLFPSISVALLPSWPLSSLHATISPLLQHIPVLLPHNPHLDALPASFFAFSVAACLLTSVLWHIAAGCADDYIMESAARGDYVGIGWLISASVQSSVFYGFSCQTTYLRLYTALCMMTGLAGSIVPFQTWFDERRNKKWRIVFFLSLCFASLLPMTHLAIAKGTVNTLSFVSPVFRSCMFYIIGLVFYAFHFPECVFPGKFDYAYSHTLWHIFIIMAIRAHYMSLVVLKAHSASFSAVGL